MSQYREALEYLVLNSCPQAIKDKKYCNECINKHCNASAKWYVDRLQELVNKEEPLKIENAFFKVEVLHFECPNCHKEIPYPQDLLNTISVYSPNYCSNCGHKLLDYVVR
jgi:DNA-directed RNA polymerase subunit RPC12/RpoP